MKFTLTDFSIFNLWQPCEGCQRCAQEKLALEAKVRELTLQIAQLKANAAPTLGPAPAYPSEVAVEVAPLPELVGWAHLKASVKGTGKAELQDAHEVLAVGQSIVLIVCDGAGSKTRSKAGADFAVKQLKATIGEFLTTGAPLGPDEWQSHTKRWLGEVAHGLAQMAEGEKQPLQEYGCTCIIVFANDDYVACTHVGDGRAGYLDEASIWRNLMVPYKGAEANSTVFLSMLTEENADSYVRHHTEPCRSRSIVALSDGPESVCWHVSTLNQTGDGLIDPNVPSGVFFGKIANQLASAAVQKVPQDKLDEAWAKFLTDGNPQLASEIDDKTLLVALRG